MSAFASLKRCAGNWLGTYRLHYWQSGVPQDSSSTMKIILLPDESGEDAIGIEYSWENGGEHQQGIIFLGLEPSGEIAAHWHDWWHTGDPLPMCGKASVGENGHKFVELLGSYCSSGGSDGEWRIELDPGVEGDESLEMRVYNIPTQCPEEIADEAKYRRHEP